MTDFYKRAAVKAVATGLVPIGGPKVVSLACERSKRAAVAAARSAIEPAAEREKLPFASCNHPDCEFYGEGGRFCTPTDQRPCTDMDRA